MTSTDASPYRIVRRIAVGGMAEVFLATRRDGTAVVLKRALPELENDASYREAIEHEAAITARLRHPNLVRTYGVVHEPGGTSLVLEYVEGTTLDVLLERLARAGRRLSVGTAVRVAVDLLDALSYAHASTDADGKALGLVHRDVGPCNLLVSRSGAVKLTDFGIARSHAPRSRTRTGTVKGTLRYLAPEQATSSAIDARTDLYAVGLILFEMLTGESYLRGDTDLQLLRAAEAPEPRELPYELGIDAAIGRALSSALARFPEERPSSAAALRQRLLPFAADEATASDELARLVEEFQPRGSEEPQAVVREDLPTAAWGTVRRPGRRAAVLSVLAASAALFAFVVFRSLEPAPPRRETRSAGTGSITAPSRIETTPTPVAERPPPPSLDPSARPSRTETFAPPRGPRQRPSTPAATGEESTGAEVPPSEVRTPPTARPSSAVTRESVRAKLARADAAIRAARARGAEVGAYADLSSSALEAYAEGRYDEADRLLDRILASVPSTSSGPSE